MFTPIRHRPLLFCVSVLLMTACAAAQTAPPPERLPGEYAKGQALNRIDEMIQWIDQQELPAGGWHAEPQFAFDGHLRLDWWLDKKTPDPDVVPTAMVGIALLRTRGHAGRTPYNAPLAEAIRYVTAAVDASPPTRLELDGKVSPFSLRVGNHVDTFLALVLLAEASERRTPTNAGKYGPQIEKLIQKIETNQERDGSWGEAQNSPVLGHALGVWALEAATRKGFEVDPQVVADAGKWVLGKGGERAEYAAMGDWKKGHGLGREWVVRLGRDDEDPINVELYLAAAQLSVLAQADRTNRAAEARLVLAAASATDPEERAAAARSLVSIRKTRTALEQAQAAVQEMLTKDYGAAPLVFASEDFVAALLLTDSLAPRSAEAWFPATVRKMMRWQDMDGGLRTDVHIQCAIRTDARKWKLPQLAGPAGRSACICERYVFAEANRKKIDRPAFSREGKERAKRDYPAIDRQYCPDYKSFCSRDRVFCTAVAVGVILADTPYKPAMLKDGLGAPVVKK